MNYSYINIEIKELEAQIQEQIAQEVSKLKADLNENVVMLKSAKTRLKNEVEALKSSNRNQTARISQLEDLLLKMNTNDSTTPVPSPTPLPPTTTKNILF